MTSPAAEPPAQPPRKRGRPRLDPLPGPAVPDDDLDMGLLEPELTPGPPPAPGPADDDELEPDPPPGFLSEPAPTGRQRGGATKTKVRVTAATRKDISAKVGFMLLVPAKLWEVRDPFCGGTFVGQLPDVREALTSIICDSPDLVAFFTGPGGSFMKYLELLTALQPVGLAVWAHHIAHSVETPQDEGQPPPDMARYAA